MSKAKGTSYEKKLVSLLKEKGFSAYRVPLSGAIGNNPRAAANLPASLVKALSGDVGVEATSGFTSFEVKYRKDATGFKTLVNFLDENGWDNYVFSDCILLNTQGILAYLSNTQIDTKKQDIAVFTPTMNTWIENSDILALFYYRGNWIFLIPRESK